MAPSGASAWPPAIADPVVFDGSPLGKIEVVGPDAPKLMDFIFYTRMSTLAPGRLRYGLMLTEGGAVFDDGVVLRLAEDRFVVSCSSSHVPAVTAHLEAWRQDIFDGPGVLIHDTTAHWATMTIAGPGSKRIIEALGMDVAFDDMGSPHMGYAEGRFAERPARVARVSFIGERSYEISVPASRGGRLSQEARRLGAAPMGVEALSVLRLEKGFIIVGADTDGETMPHDLGFRVRATSARTPIAAIAHSSPRMRSAAIGGSSSACARSTIACCRPALMLSSPMDKAAAASASSPRAP